MSLIGLTFDFWGVVFGQLQNKQTFTLMNACACFSDHIPTLGYCSIKHIKWASNSIHSAYAVYHVLIIWFVVDTGAPGSRDRWKKNKNDNNIWCSHQSSIKTENKHLKKAGPLAWPVSISVIVWTKKEDESGLKIISH